MRKEPLTARGLEVSGRSIRAAADALAANLNDPGGTSGERGNTPGFNPDPDPSFHTKSGLNFTFGVHVNPCFMIKVGLLSGNSEELGSKLQ